MSEFNVTYNLKLNSKVKTTEFKKVFHRYISGEDKAISKCRANLLFKQSKSLLIGPVKKKAEELGYSKNQFIFNEQAEATWVVDRITISESGLAKITITSNPSSPIEFFELLGLIFNHFSVNGVKAKLASTQVDGVSKLSIVKGKVQWGDVNKHSLPSHLKVQGEHIETTPAKVLDFVQLVANKLRNPEDALDSLCNEGFFSFILCDFEKTQPVFDYGIWNEFSRVSCWFWSSGGSHFCLGVNIPFGRDVSSNDRFQLVTDGLTKFNATHSKVKQGITSSDRWVWLVSGNRYEATFDGSSLSLDIVRP